MNITELLADLQARHDEATARADDLRDRIEHLTAALTETVVPRAQWPSTALAEGDRVEVLTAVQGG